MENLENYFSSFRNNIIGIDANFQSPYGNQRIVYADWIASGRMYAPLEKKLCDTVAPLLGNTHSESSETGISMTKAYHLAQQIIKWHVNASEEDILLTTGTGMTGAITKLQRLLGFKIPEQIRQYCEFVSTEKPYCRSISERNRPIIFITHLEHHSNHTSWLETIADVVIIEPDSELRVNPKSLRNELEKYKDRKMKIGSFSACSNVTGLITPYYELAELMHEYGGYCFVDFAASAPYLPMDMHPENKAQQLDAIFFSPHKFLGGPGSAGVLIFNRQLYHNVAPDQPGGGTVAWTNRWNQYHYVEDVEAKEDGGTPGFLQAIRAAMAIKLKEQMGCGKIHAREKELIEIAFRELRKISRLHILANNIEDRLGVFSFYIEGIHHNLVVKLLNDRFGIQVRGGCSCAGTYGHYLLEVDILESKKITSGIDSGDLSLKPGWIRVSLHPTMTNDELYFIVDAVKQVIANIETWKLDYVYSKHTSEFYHKDFRVKQPEDYLEWFDL